MSFFTDPVTLVLVAIALVSGGLMAWQFLAKAQAAGVAPSEAVRLMNREKATVIDVREPG